MNLFLLAIICGLPSPKVEANIAARDAFAADPVRRTYYGYISMYNVEPWDRVKVEKVVDFCCNSLSRNRLIRHPHRVTPTLLRVEIDDYRWSREAWDKLAQTGGAAKKGDQYFVDQERVLGSHDRISRVVDPVDDYSLYTTTGSKSPIMRADYFITYAMLEPFYSAFLGHPKTVAELQALYKFSEKDVKELGYDVGATIEKSSVSNGKNRQIEWWPGLKSSFWQTRDCFTNIDAQDPFDTKNYFRTKFDGQEFIWSLPNGLQAYALGDKDGKIVAEAPVKLVSHDSRTQYPDKTIYTGRSCIECHTDGMQYAKDDNRPFFNSAKVQRPGVQFKTYDKQFNEKVESFFHPDFNVELQRSIEVYANAIRNVNNWTPEANAAAYCGVIYGYDLRSVDLRQAAREIGCEPEQIERLPPLAYAPAIGMLLAGRSIQRDKFESIFVQLTYLVRGKDK